MRRIKISRSAVGAVFVLLRISYEDGASFRAKIVRRAVICQDLRQAHPVIVCHIRVGILFIKLVDDELIAGPLRGAPGCSRALSVDPVRSGKLEFRCRDPPGLPVGLVDPGVSQTVGDLFIRLHLLRIRVAFSPVGHRELPGVNIFCLFTFPKRPAAGKLRAHDAVGKKPGKHLHAAGLIGQRPQTYFRLLKRVVFIYGIGNCPLDVKVHRLLSMCISRTGKAHSILIFPYRGQHQSVVWRSVFPFANRLRNVKGLPALCRYILSAGNDTVRAWLRMPRPFAALPVIVYHLAVDFRAGRHFTCILIAFQGRCNDGILRKFPLKIIVYLKIRSRLSIVGSCSHGVASKKRTVFIARVKVGYSAVIYIGTSFEFAAALAVFYKIPCKVRLGKLNTRIDLDRIHPLRCRKPRFISRDSKIPFVILFLKRKLDILRNISVRIFHQRGCDAAEKMLFFFRV